MTETNPQGVNVLVYFAFPKNNKRTCLVLDSDPTATWPDLPSGGSQSIIDLGATIIAAFLDKIGPEMHAAANELGRRLNARNILVVATDLAGPGELIKVGGSAMHRNELRAMAKMIQAARPSPKQLIGWLMDGTVKVADHD